MKVVIIGGGYVGKRVAKALIDKGKRAIVTTRNPEKKESLEEEGFETLLLSTFDKEELKQAVKGIDAVVLCVAPSSQDTYERTYFRSAENLKEALSAANPTCQVVYTSSTSVYGDRKGEVALEGDPLTPKTPQGEVLCKTEETLLSMSHDRDVCIFRLGEIYGPGRELEKRLRKMAPGPFPGDGTSHANLSHIDDIVKGILFALDKRLTGVFNLCSQEHPTRKELYEKICDIEELPQVQWDPGTTSHHGGDKIVSSGKLIRKGFVFKHPNLNFLGVKL